mmetsp:Transcript_24526/g.56964  ORF Transcript_24526/g.56964 Transcript_24526/m.56964 type:complete len:651 (-) Transcript_24526:79-2031(-)
MQQTDSFVDASTLVDPSPELLQYLAGRKANKGFLQRVRAAKEASNAQEARRSQNSHGSVPQQAGLPPSQSRPASASSSEEKRRGSLQGSRKDDEQDMTPRHRNLEVPPKNFLAGHRGKSQESFLSIRSDGPGNSPGGSQGRRGRLGSLASESQESSGVNLRTGNSQSQVNDLKPRTKASSAKIFVQTQRMRSQKTKDLEYASRFPLLSGCCQRIVDHTAFMAAVVIVIFIQSIYMGLDNEGSIVIDVLFTSFYLIELAMRLIAYGGAFFQSGWNLMDLGLILLAIVDLVFYFSVGGSSLDVMVSLRLMRLLRLGGLVRLLRFFKPLYLLVAGIMVSIKTVVWAWLLMSLIIYVFGLVFYRALKVDMCPGGVGADDAELLVYFGSLGNSLFSVFQITTLEDWPIVSEVMSKSQRWLTFMVMLLLMLTAYGVTNVTVAIFVNSAMDASSVRSRDLAKKAKEEYEATVKALYEVFTEADSDGNGTLSKDEFEKAIVEKDLLKRLHGAGIDAASASSLFDILDIDANGTLDGNEFVEGVLRSRGHAQNKDLVGLRCDVWRANLSVQEEIRHVSIYFEDRLAATQLKLKMLTEVAAPILKRAAEELRIRRERGDSPASACGFKHAPGVNTEQATGDDDESHDPTHSAVMPFGAAF